MSARSIFLGLLRRCTALVGNSSAGIIESGFLNVDVINIGPRQSGRERADNVIDVEYGAAEVKKALETILRRRKNKMQSKPATLYGRGNSGPKIASCLANVTLNQNLKQKRVVL